MLYVLYSVNPDHFKDKLRGKMFRKPLFVLVVLFLITFALSITILAQFSSQLEASNRDNLIADGNGNGLADSGDIIQYTVVVANCGNETAQSVHYDSQIDINTQLDPNSITQSDLQDAPSVCGSGNASPPADPGPPPEVDAVAVNDAISVTNGGNVVTSITNNDAGDAPIQVISFGDTLLNVGIVPADGATILQVVAGGGTIDTTIAADGTIDVTANGTTGTGTVTIFYEIQVGNGTTDIGQIDITFGDFPTAVDDTLATLGAGNEYDTDVNVTLNVGAGAGLLNNDTLGNPAATLTLWGGGDASPSVNRAIGTSRPFAGGTLTVNADGSFDLVNPTVPGTYTFDYIIDNGLGSSQATVEIYVNDPPVAQDDAITASVGQTNTYPAPALFDDNSNGTDYLGAPPATITFFGAGSFGGAVTDNAAGATIAIPVLGGTLTINTDGSMVIDSPTSTGIFTVQYQIDNGVGTSTASITITIVATPVTQDDLLTVTLPANLSEDLTVDNGSGVDDPGVPAFTSLTFGAGSLGGAVTDNTGGASVALAGGTLTVNNDGSVTLNGATSPGSYTFDYQLTNANGTSNISTVTIEVYALPDAVDDGSAGTAGYATSTGVILTTSAATGVLQNNDDYTLPNVYDDAAVTRYADVGDIGGASEILVGNPYVIPASGGITITIQANGVIQIDASAVGALPGDYSLDYELANSAGADIATIFITITEGVLALDDAYTFLFSADQNVAAGAGLFVDNGSGADTLGSPTGALTSFGAGSLGGVVTDNAAGASVALAGGTLTINADGSWSLTGQPFTPGTYTFDYEITNAINSATATVTLVIQDPPTAQADALTATVNIVNNYGASTLFNDNSSGVDLLGTPVATLTNFGGGSLGGTVTDNVAGATVVGTFAGGNLTVNADGSLAISNPTTSGIFTFGYRLTNASGTSDATVTVTIQEPPTAQNDSYTFLPTVNQTVAAGAGLFVDNGSGVDNLGFPTATLTSFGGGSLGGTVVTNAAGATVALAGGNLTVNADGSWTLTGQPFTPGIYTFEYRLTNVAGTSDATVTLTISDPAVCAVDAYTATGNISISTLNGVNQSVLFNDTGTGLTVTGIDGTANVGIAEATTSGSITIQSNGEFTYTPNTGFTGVDSIAYEITSGFGTVVTLNCTINITVSNLIYFMDSAASAGGDGSLSNPYQTPAEHNGASPVANSILFIEDNGAAYIGGLTLVSGEHVIGEGTTGTLFGGGSLTGITLAPLSNTVSYSTTGLQSDWAQLIATNNGIMLNSNNTLSGIAIGNTTTGYGMRDNGATVGTLTITESQITGTGGIVRIINGGTLDVTFTTATTTSIAAGAIILDGVGGTGFVVQGNTSITQTGGTAPAISISNSTVTLIDISDDATLTITSRRDSGIELNTVSGTTNFGTSTVSNGNNEIEPAVSLVTVSGAVDFDSLTINQGNDGAGESFTGSFPNDNSGAGDAVYGNGATGGLTVHAGAISNVADDGFDWRASGTLTLTNVTINHQHGATGTAGIQAYNSQGVVMTGGSITNFASAAVGGQRPLGVNILHSTAYTSATGTFTFNSVDFDGNAGAAAGTALGGGIAQYSVDNAAIAVNVTNGSTFADVFAKAIITQNESTTGGTVTTTVTGSSFNAPLTGGQSSIEVASGGAGMTGNVAFNINSNTFTNFGSSQGTAILINLNQAGNARTQTNTINGNTITETTTPGVGGIGIVIDETSGLRLQANTNTVSGVSGAALDIRGLTTWTSGAVDISMTNNTLASTGTTPGITIVEDGTAGTTMEILWDNVDISSPNSTLDAVEAYVRNGGRLDLVSTNGDFVVNAGLGLESVFVQAGTGAVPGTVCVDFNDDGGGANTTNLGFWFNETAGGTLLVENGTTTAAVIADNPGMNNGFPFVAAGAALATCNDATP